ncbi:MAG: hypothetical protein KDD51_02125, partial [Bdellovibrionales bacterium]|nr:hypothetical protein [Bdellovibrionales bacterium]
RVAHNGVVSTYAGGGTQTSDGVTPLSAQLGYLQDVSVDSAGTVYLAETSTNRIRKVQNNQITAVVGSGTAGNPERGIDALTANVFHPVSVVSGNPSQLYFVFQAMELVSPVPNGRRVFGVGINNELEIVFGENGLTWGANLDTRFTQLREASGIAFHPSGDIYYTDAQNHVVMRIHKGSRGQDVVSRFAGIGLSGCTDVLGSDPGALILNEPTGIAITENGDIFVSDTGNHRILKFHEGPFNYDIGRATGRTCGAAPFAPMYNGYNFPEYDDYGNEIPQAPAVCGIYTPYPTAMAADPSGNVYAVLAATSEIVRIAPSGTARYFVGGCDTIATLPTREKLLGITSDGEGNIYVSDGEASKIHRIGSDNVGVTIAGTGARGSTGDGGPALSAQFEYPAALAYDNDRLYVADGGSIVRVHVLDGVGNPDFAELPPGYNVSPGSTRIRVIETKEDETRRVTLLVGGRLNNTCGTGTVQGSSDSSELFDQLSASLSNYCRARIRALAGKTGCDAQTNQSALVFAQSFSSVYETENPGSVARNAPSSNIIKVDRECF